MGGDRFFNYLAATWKGVIVVGAVPEASPAICTASDISDVHIHVVKVYKR